MELIRLRQPMKSVVGWVQGGPAFYPFFFAVFPILFIWSQNYGEFSQSTSAAEILVPLAISTGFTVLAVGLGSLILRDIRKAAIIVFLFLVAFFSYGHVFNLLVETDTFGWLRQRQFILVWGIIFSIGGLLALRAKSAPRSVANPLNLITGLLVATTLLAIVPQMAGSGLKVLADPANQTLPISPGVESRNSRPDIYYIIPDGYTSSRNLKEVLGYDDSDFTGYLTNKGFFVARDSHANHVPTATSIASSLNMQYVDYLGGVMPEGSLDQTVFPQMIRNNKVMDFLRGQGYKIAHTRDPWIPERKGDINISCAGRPFYSVQVDDFSGALIHSTVLEPVLRVLGKLESQLQSLRLCDFARIIESKDIEGPKMVFAHLYVPHAPYIFGPNGEKVAGGTSTTDQGTKGQYLDQVIFVSKQLQEVVDALLSGPGEPPVIVIQADHGTSFSGNGFDQDVYREMMGIFNAYYLPNGGNNLLYDSITPVNTFRVIFNKYFGAELELLEDRSYYTNLPIGRFNYLDVTDLITSGPRN